MSKEKYYTSQELTDIFKVSRYTIYRAQKSGALPVAKKDGVRKLYRESDVMNYIGRSGEAENRREGI